jgi:iron-sulfur cluster repair protein YtfE (RIC family)
MARHQQAKGPRSNGQSGGASGQPERGDDPFARLIADHRKVEQLFEQIKEAEGDGRQQLVDQLAASLRLHFMLEEDIVYPLIEQDVEEEMAEEGEIEHGLARDGLEKVESLSPDAPGFEAALDMLAAGIHHHVQDEESEAFPSLRDNLDGDELGDLGRRLAEARKAAEDDPGRVRAGRRAGRGKSGKGDKTGKEPTKKELLERAKKAGIERRSSMTKAELADALAKQ